MPGWYLVWKSDGSVRTGPSATTRASSARSIVGAEGRNLAAKGSAPGFCAVESALAMFSEMIRMRPACARNPDAAIEIDFKKSMGPSPDAADVFQVAPAERRLDQAEAARVERGRGLIVHLVGGDLEHLVFEAHGVAGRPHLEFAAAIELELCSIARGRPYGPAASAPWRAPARPRSGRTAAAPGRAA